MLLDLSKYKLVKTLVGCEIEFNGNDNVQGFAGRVVDTGINGDELIVSLRDQEDNLYDVDIKDIDINDLVIDDKLKDLFNKSTAVLTDKECMLMYFKDSKKELMYQVPKFDKYGIEKPNTIWSTIDIDGKKFMVNEDHKDNIGLNGYTEFSYNINAKIIVLLEDENESLMSSMLMREKSMTETINCKSFDSKYLPFLDDQYEELNIGLYKDAIMFIKKYIGVPEDRDAAIGAFLWSNVDSTYNGNEDSEDGCNMFTINGYSMEEFGFVVSQLPWKNLKEKYASKVVGGFYPLNKIIVDHRE